VDKYPNENWNDFLGFTKQEIAPVEPINKVVKRDGRVQSYDSSRIFSAIRKAIKATRGARRPGARKRVDRKGRSGHRKADGRAV
jgi:hypothetical protein